MKKFKYLMRSRRPNGAVCQMSAFLASARKVRLALLFGGALVVSAFAQETIPIGFEEFPVGATPTFANKVVIPMPRPDPVVADRSSLGFSAFAGEKYLLGYDQIIIESPNHQPIQSYRMQVYVPVSTSGLAFLNISGHDGFVAAQNNWQTIEGSFNTPVSSVWLYGYSVEGEIFPWQYGIDSIEFITVPEPSTNWLLAAGLGALVLRPWQRRKTTRTL